MREKNTRMKTSLLLGLVAITLVMVSLPVQEVSATTYLIDIKVTQMRLVDDGDSSGPGEIFMVDPSADYPNGDWPRSERESYYSSNYPIDISHHTVHYAITTSSLSHTFYYGLLDWDGYGYWDDDVCWSGKVEISGTTGTVSAWSPDPGYTTSRSGGNVKIKTTQALSKYFDGYWHYDGLYFTIKVEAQGGGGGGGCPNLLAWNGENYVDEGILNIHNDDDPYVDTIIHHQLSTNLSPIGKHFYNMKLSEIGEGYSFSHSYLDYVRLFVVTNDGNQVECPLIYARHSVQGNVLFNLLKSDDKFTETYIGEEVNLLFLEPIYIWDQEKSDFIFILEGHNPGKT